MSSLQAKIRVLSVISLSLLATAFSATLVPGVAHAQEEAPPTPPAQPEVTPPPPALAPADPTPAAEPEPLVTPPPVASDTLVGPNAPLKDEPTAAPGEKAESKLPFRGSTFLFDQSMTTQTAHLETDPQQSYVPLYEMWLSFRPRYHFTDKLSFRGRFDYYKEFTNSGETAKYRQDVFGDIWTDLVYSTPVPAISKNLKVSAGIRALWPTSKESQGNGVFVTGGLTSGANYKINLKGETAKFLNDAHVAVSVAYGHPFSRATTPTESSFGYTRQDTEGRSFVSDQLRGGTLTNHSLLTVLDTGLQITPKFSLTLDMILINKWRYAPKGDVTIPVTGGSASVPRSSDAPLFSQNTWFVAGVSYDIMDEIGLSLGYYNLANALAQNGQRRGIVGGDNIWWSPDARVYFDITANLDKIYERFVGVKANKSTTAKAPPPRVQIDPARLGAL